MFEKLTTEELLSTLQLALPYLTNLLVALFILALAWVVSNWAHGLIYRSLSKKVDRAVSSFLAQIARYSLLAAGVIAALGRGGVETTSVVAIFASAGLAVGLRQVFLSAAAANARVVSEPATDLSFVEMAGSSINFMLRVWVDAKDVLPVGPELREATYEALLANHIDIPFPQVVVHKA